MLRGKLALIVLGVLCVAYCADIATGQARPEDHKVFWMIIGFSVLLTFVSVLVSLAWGSFKNKDDV